KFISMDSAKEQKIIVLTTQSAADETLISYGFRLAVIFNKELCLLFRFNNKNEILKNRVEAGLHSHIRNLDNNNNSVNISTLGIKEKLKVLPELLADDHEAIMIVASAP